MAEKLTRQQEQAVYNRGGRLLVSAAAGSGKTKVLVDRLMTYLTDPVDPANLDEFLIITYTKAAAMELRGKIAAKLTQRIAQEPENRHLQKQMQRLFLTKISTVHGFCSDLLREYAYRLDIAPDFRVADESECRQIRDEVLSDLLDSAYAQEDAGDFRAFADTQGLGRDDRLLPQILEQVYDSARCHLDPKQWLDGCLAAADVQGTTDAAQTLWGRFLMEDLQEALQCQILVLGRCVQALEGCDGMDKAVANLRATVQQLQQLAQADSWDQVHQMRTIDYGRLTFPRKNNPDPELTQRVKAARDACKRELERKLRSFTDDSARVLEDLAQSAAGTRGLVALVRQFDRAYTGAKKSRRCLDFGDLEHRTLDLLLGASRTSPTAAAREVGRRYREILVDEYQDSNGVQDAIFTVLTREKQNCFLVGDVKQSIYRFRLADPGIFLEKYETYVPVEQAQPGQGRKVLLSHNFRSGGEVISAVNDVFRACMRPRVGGLTYGEGEALREGIPHTPLDGPGVELYAIETEEDTYAEEADFAAQRIQQMLLQGTRIRRGEELVPVQPEDIVILLRSPGSAAGYFQRALERRGIRCTSGSGTDLLRTEEIATFRALLQVILNPRQDIPLVAVLASPVFGFTADDLARIRSSCRQDSFYDCLIQSQDPRAEEFLSTLTALRQQARIGTLTGLLEACFLHTRMDSIYAAMEGGQARQANLQAFFQLAVEFEQGSLRDLPQFLEHLQALEGRGLTAAQTAPGGAVTIMSIHKSKGLEFPVVFLCNLSRSFNQENLRAQILCDQQLGLGLSVADTHSRVRYPSMAKRAIAVKLEAESVSEELRVLYVAMTRAKDRLVMTYAAKKLEKDLQDIASRMDWDGGELLCRQAPCMGQWVLLAALGRTEAGQLHALGGRPRQTRLGQPPWTIQLVQGAQSGEGSQTQSADARQAMPEDILPRLEAALAFRYPHPEATQAPSKRTATDRKGRFKDEEAAEEAPQPQPGSRSWRQPAFLAAPAGGKAQGSATHLAMQYIRYDHCGSEADIAREIQRLVERGLLTQEQGQMISCGQIARFFAGPIGSSLRQGTPHLREFKFSLLDDGRHYDPGLEGEQVLLQGVVDCALLEPDGITVIDFKTDRVDGKTLQAAAQRYSGQVRTYADALSRIYRQPIKARYLYFFQLDQLVEVL